MRIFLVGFMGTGKSHWGRRWAIAHDIPFYDLDELIEKEEQCSILEIFDKNGEDYFRQKEAIMLRSMIQYDHCIISCGGGAACYFDNMAWMNKNGVTILLDANPPYILKNIKKETGRRPLIENANEAELLFFIEQKLKERMPFYSRAKMILPARDLDMGSFEKIINTINW